MNSELKELLKRFDIPPRREEDIHWLLRNLAIRNQFKPGFVRTMELLKEEVKKDYTRNLSETNIIL